MKTKILSIVIDWIKQETRCDKQTINADAELIDSGCITLLQYVELIAFLEKRFGIRFEEEDLFTENFCTANAIAELVHEYRSRNKRAYARYELSRKLRACG